MNIDAKLVAELRARTGLPMMKCKEALQTTAGDLALAEEHLRKLGLKTAEKVKDRTLKEGLVFLHADGPAVAAVAVLCETDFVARSQDFTAFGRELASKIAAAAKAGHGAGEEVASLTLGDGRTAADHVTGLIGKIRENIAIGRWARIPKSEGHVAHYLHHNGRVAALVALAGAPAQPPEALKQLGSDLCMHVTFHGEVQALSRSEIDPAWIEKEKEIFLAQVQDMPENKRQNIAQGKLNKRIGEVVLLEQPFVKDEKRTVEKVVEETGKQLGVPLRLRRFARIAAGA